MAEGRRRRILVLLGLIIGVIILYRWYASQHAKRGSSEGSQKDPNSEVAPPVRPPETTYEHIGCYGDSIPRAIPTAEGTDPVLDGENYSVRSNAIQKCFTAARNKGHRIFAVQHGGWCATAPTEGSHAQYGASNACVGGRGGPNANDVYRIQ